MMRRFLISMAILVAAPLQAVGQTPAQRIEAVRARMGQLRIPVELIDAKVAEGRAKGVPIDRIAAAVERRGAGLATAQTALSRPGRPADRAELSAGADAVDAGIDASSMRAAVQAASPGHGAIALAVLTQLHLQGMPVDRALEMVRRAAAQGDQAVADLAQQSAGRGNSGNVPRAGNQGRGQGRGRPAGVGGGPPAGVPSGRKPHPEHPNKP